MIKKALFTLAIVATGYFNYWQGFYRGADMTLCVIATTQANKPIIARRCNGINNVYFHWSWK